MDQIQKLSEYLGTNLKEDCDINQIIEDNNLTFDSIDDQFINTDDAVFCEVEEINTHIDNAFYCEYSEEYFTLANYESIKIGRKYLSSYWKENNELNTFDLIELHDGDIVPYDCATFVESEGAYFHQDECYYWELDNNYHLEPEPEGGCLFDYHSNNREDYSRDSIFKVGFEVEKEDESVKENIDAFRIFNKTGWACEKDGSLDGETGFEAVSPCFDLFETNFEFEFEKVRDLIDANYSKKCGGHITISEQNLSSEQLFDSLLSYVPLFYCLYPNRVGVDYCKGKSPNELKADKTKYSSFYLKCNGLLEIRIFPAVRNIKNLLWRVGFIKILLQNKRKNSLEVIGMLLDENSNLTMHLSTVLSEQRIKEILRTYVKYIQEFGEILSASKLQEIENSIETLKLKN